MMALIIEEARPVTRRIKFDRRGMPLSSLFLCYSNDLVEFFLSYWLDPRTLGALDTAITSTRSRPLWMKSLSTIFTTVFDNFNFGDSSMRWLIKRRISITKIHVDWKKKLQLQDSSLCGVDMPSLTSLDLSGCVGITDEGVIALAHGCPNLLSVNLTGCYDIVTTSISDLALCSKLESANFSEWNVTDSDILAPANMCPKVKSPDLANCDIRNAGISALALSCPKLSSINLAGCWRICDEDLVVIANGLRNILCILLEGCDITDEGVTALAKGCPLLTTINLDSTDVRDSGIAALATGCPDLKSVSVIDCEISHVGVSHLARHCSKLESLTLTICGIADAYSVALQGCENLKFVILSFCELSDEGLTALGHWCRKLEYTELGE
jgi:Leucine Rich repeat